MKASRPSSRGAQPLSKHRSAFGAGPESFRFEYPDTSFAGRRPGNPCSDLAPSASGRTRIFVLSKSPLPLDELYVAANMHNLITHAEGQSALNSCLRYGI